MTIKEVNSDSIFQAKFPSNYKQEDKTTTFMQRMGLKTFARMCLHPATLRGVTHVDGTVEPKVSKKDLTAFSFLVIPYAILAAVFLPIIGVGLICLSPFIAEEDQVFTKSQNTLSIALTGVAALFSPAIAALLLFAAVTGLIIGIGCLLKDHLAIPFSTSFDNWDEHVTLKTPDGDNLSACYRYAYQDESEATTATIFFPGNGGSWEDESMSMAANTDLLVINPRGVGRSEGSSSPEKLALDGYTAFEYLVDEKGFDPENITLHGWSLGAGALSLATDIIQKKYPDKTLKILNERSFSKLSLAAKVNGGKPFGWLFSKMVKWAGWEIDAAQALKDLQNKSVKSEIMVTSSEGDKKIDKASLARTIDPNDTSYTKVYLTPRKPAKKDTHEWAFKHFKPESTNTVYTFLGKTPGKMADTFEKDRKKFIAEYAKQKAFNNQLRKLLPKLSGSPKAAG